MLYLHEKDIDRYLGMDKRLDEALKLIRDGKVQSQASGRHEHSDNLYYLCQQYAPKAVQDTRWEAHMRYIDVQYAIEGGENIGILPTEEALALESLDEGRDVKFFKGPDVGRVPLEAGMIMVFYPTDPHRPGIQNDRDESICKVVFKVRVAAQ